MARDGRVRTDTADATVHDVTLTTPTVVTIDGPETVHFANDTRDGRKRADRDWL
jgi:hypothetical protein